MKWRTRQPGDRRTRLGFAWLPTRCDDGTTRWLERLEVTEQWIAAKWFMDWYTPAHWARVSTLPAAGVRELKP